MNENQTHKCPQCGKDSESVAAIHYNQTQTTEEGGSFSGVGIGITPTGAAPVIGGGSYGGTKTVQSKLAEMFYEPKKINNASNIAILFILVIPCFYFGLSFIKDLFPSNHQNSIFEYFSIISYFLTALLSILAITIFLKTSTEDSEYNTHVYPKEIERFNTLRYCKDCHTISDPQGHTKTASKEGYLKLLRME